MKNKYKYAIAFSAEDSYCGEDMIQHFDRLGFEYHSGNYNGVLVSTDEAVTPVEIIMEFKKYMESSSEYKDRIESARLIRFYDEGDLLNAKLKYAFNK